MAQGKLTKNGQYCFPQITEDSFFPNIDSTFSVRSYNGQRIVINTNVLPYGIKTWESVPSNMQGMAIYGDLLVRMANVSTSTTHYIYKIGTNGTLTQVAQFTLSTTGHSNTLQFAPTVEDGNTYPYLYVSDLSGSCEVLNISSNYLVTQVQKITVPTGWQVQIGDDGYIWAIVGGGQSLRFIKYRRVSVLEGDVTLTQNDILADIPVEEKFDPSLYTFQGSKFKFGKAWLPIGTTGTGQRRCIFVFDIIQQRTFALIDLTDYGNIEFEDLDFWNNSLILATYGATNYILRF